MYIVRDMGILAKSDPLRGLRASQPTRKPAAKVKLSSAGAKAKPVRVVKLRGGDPVQRAKDLEQIRKLDRAGLNEHNCKAVKVMKDNFFRRYGERV
ncbi:hypothetical protein LB553_05445 [Mesorhizobium sp. CA8]|uniref:hypothetical protein n=1 Tax=Mesorhizobium sp. CA8 TaxID=2876637 RepID=UPI001CCC4510|nr:hypothetical protein [Mesorhizobium sp. CA8]MBZ9760319.1 hypothetical protein [Mesorhizobium sp. CA8]